MKKENILTRKIQLIPVGDDAEVRRVYKYISDGMYAQYRAMNLYISSLYAMDMAEATKEDRKEATNLFSRISSSSKGSAYSTDIQFPVGLDTACQVQRKVKADHDNAVKGGVYGKEKSLSHRIKVLTH